MSDISNISINNNTYNFINDTYSTVQMKYDTNLNSYIDNNGFTDNINSLLNSTSIICRRFGYTPSDVLNFNNLTNGEVGQSWKLLLYNGSATSTNNLHIIDSFNHRIDLNITNMTTGGNSRCFCIEFMKITSTQYVLVDIFNMRGTLKTSISSSNNNTSFYRPRL